MLKIICTQLGHCNKSTFTKSICCKSTYYCALVFDNAFSKLSYIKDDGNSSLYTDDSEDDKDETSSSSPPPPPKVIPPGLKHRVNEDGEWKYSNNDTIINFYETQKVKQAQEFTVPSSVGFNSDLLDQYTSIFTNCRNVEDINISTIIHRIIMTYQEKEHKRTLLKEHPKFMSLLMLHIQKHTPNFSARHVL